MCGRKQGDRKGGAKVADMRELEEQGWNKSGVWRWGREGAQLCFDVS